MRKICWLGLITFIFFMVEFLLFNFFGYWLRPNLLIILIIFINSYFGIRYSLFVALLAGLLKDSFGVGIFGVYLFSFIFCVYAAVVIKRYFYELESGILKVLTTFFVSLLNGVVVYALYFAFGIARFPGAFKIIIIPQVLVTTLIAVFIYDRLKKCALKFSV